MRTRAPGAQKSGWDERLVGSGEITLPVIPGTLRVPAPPPTGLKTPAALGRGPPSYRLSRNPGVDRKELSPGTPKKHNFWAATPHKMGKRRPFLWPNSGGVAGVTLRSGGRPSGAAGGRGGDRRGGEGKGGPPPDPSRGGGGSQKGDGGRGLRMGRNKTGAWVLHQ
eukprot:gene25143-biopygen7459